jgi:Fic family protein
MSSPAPERTHMIHWIRFFLVAVHEASQKGKNTFHEILALRSEVEHQVVELGVRAPNGRRLLSYLYTRPIVTANEAAEHLNVSHQTASALLRDFERLQILRELTGHSRNRKFVFSCVFRPSELPQFW